jgi:hypothetical protein
MSKLTSDEWIQVWEKRAASAVYGLEARLQHNTKRYRGYAAVMLGPDEKRLHSPEYEACDFADVDESRLARGSIVGEVRQREEMAIQEAEAARALMTDKQRSPKDMQALAIALAEQLSAEAAAYDEAARVAAQQRAYDEAALQVARPLVRGLQLLLEQGSDEEKATLRSLFGRGK